MKYVDLPAPEMHIVQPQWIDATSDELRYANQWLIRPDGRYEPASHSQSVEPRVRGTNGAALLKVISVAKEWRDLTDTLGSIYAGQRAKELYQPIPHPAFADWRVIRNCKRFDAIADYLAAYAGFGVVRAFDIGSNLGYLPRALYASGVPEVFAMEESGKCILAAAALDEVFGTQVAYVHTSQVLPTLEYVGPCDVISCISVTHRLVQTNTSREWIESLYRTILSRCRIFVADLMGPGDTDLLDRTRVEWKSPPHFARLMRNLGAKSMESLPGQPASGRPIFIVRT